MARTIWILAGESSGDVYGARLAAMLRELASDVDLRGMGGEAMREAGVDILVDSTHLGIVGFVEVLKHLPMFLRIKRDLIQRAIVERPDCVVLIDYPGFNLRFAEAMHAAGIRVVYYICPQVWAWGKHRIPKIAKIVDKLLAIFPFEPAVFEGTGLDIEFVGHPLIEIVDEARDPALVRDPATILLLPGSRINEVNRLLQPILDTAIWLAERHPEIHFVLPAPNRLISDHVEARIEARRQKRNLPPLPEIDVEIGGTRKWFQVADAGLAASGTVTVEAAMAGLPLVVVYRLNWLSHLIARRLVKIPFFTMVNLVVKRRVFDEYLQGDVRAPILGPAMEGIMRGGARRAEVEAGIQEMVEALGGHEQVCRRTATKVLETAGGE